MNYEDLTPEQNENIQRAARIGKCADLLVQIALENDLTPEVCSAMVIGIANQRYAKIKGDGSLVEVVG